jgi:D-alanyl-D-alanine carboxypeptidase
MARPTALKQVPEAKPNSTRWVAGVAAALVLAACSAASGAPPSASTTAARVTSQRSLPPETEHAIDGIVAEQMSANHFPGMEVGVWLPGRRSYVRAFGVANLETGEPMDTKDRVRIASITKTFTATVVLQLVDDKNLGLDDHLSEFVEGIPNGEQITIRQLLNMTAGVYDYFEDPEFIAWMYGDPRTPFSTDAMLEIARRHGPEFPPGQAWGYSNTNYTLLGLIIEKVTGRPVEAVVKDRILDRLDLDETSYPKTPAMPKPYAHGYLSINGQPRDVTEFDASVVRASGGLVSTLDNLRVWANALARGSLVSHRMQQERLKTVDTAVADIPGRYGLGIGERDGYLGHGGRLPGYSSLMFARSDGTTIVVLANNFDPDVPRPLGEAFQQIRTVLDEVSRTGR